MNLSVPKDERAVSGGDASNSDLRKRSVAVIDNRIDSRDLFIATREIIIEHGDDRYRLRLTSQNKLILTK